MTTVSYVGNSKKAVNRLFYAVSLDEVSADSAACAGAQLCGEQYLQAKDRFHITLHWLDDHVTLPEALVADAMVAGSRVDVSPFNVMFDLAETPHGTKGGKGLVLKSSTGLVPLRRLQRYLGQSMEDSGIGHLKRAAFKPHVTLAYDGGPIDAQKIDPICWTVKEFVLIHSVIGESKHIVRGRWPLQDRQLRLW